MIGVGGYACCRLSSSALAYLNAEEVQALLKKLR